MNFGLEYPALAATLVSDMEGTFATTRLGGLDLAHLNADDCVGAVKQLNLTTNDLNTINALAKHEKGLTFTNKNSSGKVTDEYTVMFSFET